MKSKTLWPDPETSSSNYQCSVDLDATLIAVRVGIRSSVNGGKKRQRVMMNGK